MTACDVCEVPFTDGEWDDPECWADYHADCCPHCQPATECAGCLDPIVGCPVRSDRGAFCSDVCADRADDIADADRAFFHACESGGRR